MMRRGFLGIIAAAALMGCFPQKDVYDAEYYLVRHAEKTAETPDPALTAEGELRARDLAERLSKVKLTAIYSSDYKRTRDTAAPIASAQGLEVTLYNPKNLNALAKDIRAQQGAFLVVGHSNTTPELSTLLGGLSGEPIVEATEYNRLYVLQRNGDKITSRIELYGH